MALRHLLCAVSLVLMVALVGCPKPPDTTSSPNVDAGAPNTAGSTEPAADTGSEELATCPVMGTTMPKDKMIPLEHEGETYYVCCQSCVGKFKANPQKYIDNPHKPLPPSSGM